ncbi:MAG: (Fe-S)-binding protein [bacterium]
MSLEALKKDMDGCSRCSHCKWTPHLQIKSWRFARGCPSVDRFNFHAYSGGGKLNMANSILEGRSELNDAVAEVIYRCQLCGACQVACQAYRDDIDVADVLLELRARCVEEGFVLPEHLELIESMKREGNTVGMRKADRGVWASELDLPDVNEQRVEALFHTGCRYSCDEDLWQVARLSVRLLRNAGVDVGIAGREEGCCGGRAYELGYQGEMKNYAEDMASRVRASGCKTLITPCSDCYYTFKYLYPKNGLGLGVEVLHVTEVLASLIKGSVILPAKKVPLKITYHDPCHLGRRGEIYKEWHGSDKLLRSVKYKQTGKLGVFEPPRDILRAIPGIELVEMERIREYSWCCGAGGGVLEAEPAFSAWTAHDRLQEARATGAEALVTACPWCERVFKDAAAVSEAGDALKVYDVTEVLSLALEGE